MADEITLSTEPAPAEAPVESALAVEHAIREAEHDAAADATELAELHHQDERIQQQVYEHTHPEYERGEEWTSLQSGLSELRAEMAAHQASHSALETATESLNAAAEPEEIEIATPPPAPKRPGRSLLRRRR